MNRVHVLTLVPLLTLPLLRAPSAVQAQQTAIADSAPPARRVFVKSDLVILGAFTAATMAMLPLDSELAQRIRDDHLVNDRTLQRVEQALEFVGGPGTIVMGGTMYLVGRFGGVPRAAHLALHTGEAIAVGLTTSGVLKILLGRARPFVTADSNASDFGFGRGLRGDMYQAFPSGHTTTSFSVAAAVTSETSEWWPRSRWIIGPLLYGGATLVGVSRMYDDKHWASDVVMGAAIGTFAGLKTVRFNHTRAGNRLDRWFLGDVSVRVRFPHAGEWGETRFGVDVSW